MDNSNNNEPIKIRVGKSYKLFFYLFKNSQAINLEEEKEYIKVYASNQFDRTFEPVTFSEENGAIKVNILDDENKYIFNTIGAYSFQIRYNKENERYIIDKKNVLVLVDNSEEETDNNNSEFTNENETIELFIRTQEKGIKGDKGDQGEQGIQGEKGEKGDKLTFADLTEEDKRELKGDKGDQGIQGERGENGANGKSALDYLNENNTEFIEKIKELLPQGGEINYNDEYFNYENIKIFLLNYGNHLKDFLIEKEEEKRGFNFFYTAPQNINIKNHFNTIYKIDDGLVYKPLYRLIPKVNYACTSIEKDYTINNKPNYKYAIENYLFYVDFNDANITFIYEYDNKNYIYILDFGQIERRKRQKLFAYTYNNKIKEYGLAFSDDIETIEGDKLNKLKESYPNLVFAKKAVVSDIIETEE